MSDSFKIEYNGDNKELVKRSIEYNAWVDALYFPCYQEEQFTIFHLANVMVFTKDFNSLVVEFKENALDWYDCNKKKLLWIMEKLNKKLLENLSFPSLSGEETTYFKKYLSAEAFVDLEAILKTHKLPSNLCDKLNMLEREVNWGDYIKYQGLEVCHGIKEGIVSPFRLLLHPMQTVKGIGNMIMHPINTSQAIVNQIKERPIFFLSSMASSTALTAGIGQGINIASKHINATSSVISRTATPMMTTTVNTGAAINILVENVLKMTEAARLINGAILNLPPIMTVSMTHTLRQMPLFHRHIISATSIATTAAKATVIGVNALKTTAVGVNILSSTQRVNVTGGSTELSSEQEILNYESLINVLLIQGSYTDAIAKYDAIAKNCDIITHKEKYSRITRTITEVKARKERQIEFINKEHENIIEYLLTSMIIDVAIFKALHDKIISSISFATKLFTYNDVKNITWLHILRNVLPLHNKDLLWQIHAIARHVMKLGISPYTRTSNGYTAFNYGEQHDVFSLSHIFQHGSSFVFKGSLYKLAGFVGIEAQVKTMKEFFDSVLKNPKIDSHVVLLAGPPGVGKTEIVNIIAREHGFEFIEYKSADQEDKWLNQHAARITKFIDDAIGKKSAVCIFMDEMDSICPQNGHQYSSEATNAIKKAMNKLSGTKVILIGATNYLHKIEQAIKSRSVPVMFSLPDVEDRKKIVEDGLCSIILPKFDNIISAIATATSGYSPRNLKQYISKIQSYATERLLTINDFDECLEFMKIALKAEYKIRGIDVEFPKIYFTNKPQDKLFGLTQETTKELHNLITFLKESKNFLAKNIYQRSCLLYGPPGTGKTSFARHVCNESNTMFVNVATKDENLVKEIFAISRGFEKAVMVFDEIDKYLTDEIIGVLQSELDGITQYPKNALVVIATTNYFYSIPEALIRRLPPQLIGLPSLEQLIELYQGILQKNELFTDNLNDVAQQFALKSEGFSCADVAQVIKDAIFNSACENRAIVLKDLLELIDAKRATPAPITFSKQVPCENNIQREIKESGKSEVKSTSKLQCILM